MLNIHISVRVTVCQPAFLHFCTVCMFFFCVCLYAKYAYLYICFSVSPSVLLNFTCLSAILPPAFMPSFLPSFHHFCPPALLPTFLIACWLPNCLLPTEKPLKSTKLVNISKSGLSFCLSDCLTLLPFSLPYFLFIFLSVFMCICVLVKDVSVM